MWTYICGGVYLIPANIIVPYTGRSDEGLVDPIVRDLPGSIKMHVSWIGEECLKFWKPKYILIVGDRLEMLDVAIMAFKMRIPIVHMYAGVIASHVTMDELVRPIITILSSVQLCESEETKDNVELLLTALGKTPNAHIVGITHLDNLHIDESLVPDKEYNLILYNPRTIGKEMLNIVLGPNQDIIYYNDLPRSQFLGLLKNCRFFFSNSSSVRYEAPYLLEERQIVPIGDRNAIRTKVELRPGGARKIKEVLGKDERTQTTEDP